MSWNCNQYGVGKCKVTNRLRVALKVIHTWATFRNGEALTPEHVADLCSKALAETDGITGAKKQHARTV